MGERRNGRNHGEVFTAKEVVCYQLDQLGYVAERDLQDIRILEPPAGSGAFALEIVKRLQKSSQIFGFNFINNLQSNVRFVEVDKAVYKGLLSKIKKITVKLSEVNADLRSVCINADFLQLPFANGFHYIVGNPPYIRHERLSPEQKEYYRSRFTTFTHRADLYVAFFEKSLNLLKPKGSLSFSCSNRWLTNQYGMKLREKIASEFRLIKLLNMEQASPFDGDVIAYPCITLIRNELPAGETLVFDTHDKTLDFNQIIIGSHKCQQTEIGMLYLFITTLVILHFPV